MKTLNLNKKRLVAGTLALFTLSLPATAAGWAPLLADDEEEEEEKEPVPEEERTQYLFVHDADIHTGTGEVLRGASLLAKDGKVVEVGYDIEVPGIHYFQDMPDEERDFRTRTLDARGMRVYPGIVAISSSGLTGTGGDFRDSIDPFSQNIVLGLAAGITTTGQGRAAVKLKRYVELEPPLPYDFDGIVLSESTYTSVSYTSSASRRGTREKMVRTAEYLREYRKWQEDVKRDKELKEPDKRGVDSNLLSILDGSTFGRFRADDRDDLLAIARLAQEFNFRPIIEGCREGWTVADELGRAGAMAVVTPRDRRDKDERLVAEGGSSIENAAILSRAGVQVAVVPQSQGISLDGIVGRDIMHLPVEVGFAIRGGLSDELALASITTVPARMMGVGHRVGTLEVGKDADLIVTDGDLLHYQTFVQYTVIDGQVVYDKQEELFFSHIRPRDEVELAPENPLDSGENPEEEPAEEEPAASAGE
jgi:hypothetical protein